MAECGGGHVTKEYAIFEAFNALDTAYDMGVLDTVIEGLDYDIKEALFEDYVLKTEYDELKAKLWVAQVSSSIQGS
jgi:regulator of replication initiation timing